VYGVGQLAKVLLLQYHDDGARLSLGMAYGMILNVLLICCPSVNDCVTFTEVYA
jgi:hypothetical protein